MTGGQAAAAVGAAVVGAGVAAVLARIRTARPGSAPVRANWRGAPVPVVLGEPLVLGGLAGLGVLAGASALGWDAAATGSVGAGAAVALAGTAAAGWWDDRRTNEHATGFSGHLRALRTGRVTGGVVKIVAGAAAGLAAGALVADGREVVEIGIVVALSANLVNLLDRAPGRAAKVSIAATVALVVAAPAAWALAGAGTVGALAACLPPDLRERGMLGDTGANPAGAVVGLGLATALDGGARVAAAIALAALNLASERWSFSEIIDRTPWLRAVDRIGRRTRAK